MSEYHTIYKAPEGETTQWDDIQARLGNRAAKPKPAPAPKWEAAPEASRASRANVEAADADALEDLEDDFEDDRELAALRAKRMRELQESAAKAQAPGWGSLGELTRAEWSERVTRAPRGSPVVVLLTAPRQRQSAVAEACVSQLAERYPHTCFLKIRALEAIANFPEENVPTLLAYLDGKCLGSVAGLKKMGGEHTSPDLMALAINEFGDICGDNDPASVAKRVANVVAAAAKAAEDEASRQEDQEEE
ncbi:hypothetical protein H632_c1506p0 [Helicosporidium sp. ATCC 50920]|nr:hypothetical protein H632_c1506p0 [Helicosporidium sp. ATCC 50920]|eukprot:KDD74182.1 hypothetical protein H632_c1506p0 [Helicosporidium sp. ATCC 50920]